MSDLHFDHFTLSPDRLSLAREGEALRLEPRLTELLVFLVQHRDRVVTKEELIESVWEGRFIGDSAISRAIYEIRRILEDDSKNPRYVRTVHGRGYQFIGTVSPFSGPDNPPRELPLEALAPTPPASAKRWVVPAILAVVALLIIGLRTIPRSSPRSSGPAGPTSKVLPSLDKASEGPATHTRLALLPVVSDEHSADLQLIALTLTDLLYQRLQETPGLAVRAPIYDAGQVYSMASLSQYSERAGAENLLIGSVSRGALERSVKIDLELIDFHGGHPRQTPLGPFLVEGPTSSQELGDFLELRDAVVSQVLDILDQALSPPSEDPTRPTNFDAYRLFLLAHQSLLESSCSSGAATELLERSVEQDPMYAPAWALLALSHVSQVSACGASSDHYDAARSAVERSVELAPTYVTPRLIENIMLIESGEVELAYERLRSFEPSSPELPHLLSSEIYSLRFAGFLQEAERTIDKLLQSDPFYFGRGPAGESPNTLLYLQNYQGFLDFLPDSSSAIHVFYRGMAEMLLGHDDNARAVLAPVFRNNPSDIFARYSQALLALLDDDPKAAELIVDQIVNQRDQLQSLDGEMTFKEAQFYALAGARSKALRRLDQTVDQGFFCPRCIASSSFLRSLTSDPQFAVIVEKATRRHLEFAERFGLEPDLP